MGTKGLGLLLLLEGGGGHMVLITERIKCIYRYLPVKKSWALNELNCTTLFKILIQCTFSI